MLGKLFKHEWKAIWKFLLAMVIFNLVLTVVGVIGIFLMPDMNSNDSLPLFTFYFGMIYFITYALGLSATFLGTGIFMGVRFYKSMYGHEGYLTHTLPVTPLQLITAKVLTASLAVLINVITTFISAFTLLVSLLSALDIYVFGSEFEWEIRMALEAARTSLPEILITACLMAIVGSITSILTVFASASLGQLFNKYRGLGTVGIYFGFTIVVQIITSIIMTGNMIVQQFGPHFNFMSTYVQSVIVNAILGVGFFLLTYFLTKKKLNLE